MHNQHAGLSQVLAEQHISQRREWATQARLAHSARLPRRRRTVRVVRGWWQPARWSGLATDQPVSPLASQQLIDRRTTMSKLARVLAAGALLTAMSLGSTAHAQSSASPSQPASGTQPGPPPAPDPGTPTPPAPPVLQQLTVSASPAQGQPGTTVTLEADLSRCPQLTSANGVFVDHASRSRPLAGQITRASQFIARYTVTAADAVGQGRFQVDCLRDATVVGRGSVNFQVLPVSRPELQGRVTVAVSPPAGRPGTVVTITAQVPGGCPSALAFFQDRKGWGVSNSARRAGIVTSGDRQLVARYTITNNDAVGKGRFGVACDPDKPTARVGHATFQVQPSHPTPPTSGPNPPATGPNPPSGDGQGDDGNGGTVQLPDRIDTGQGGTADGTRQGGLDPVVLLPAAGLLLITLAAGLWLRQRTARSRR